MINTKPSMNEVLNYFKSIHCRTLFLRYLSNKETIRIIKEKVIPQFHNHIILDKKITSTIKDTELFEVCIKSKSIYANLNNIFTEQDNYEKIEELLIKICVNNNIDYPNKYEHQYNILDFYLLEEDTIIEKMVEKINEIKGENTLCMNRMDMKIFKKYLEKKMI